MAHFRKRFDDETKRQYALMRQLAKMRLAKMRINITDHARERVNMRGVSVEEIREVLIRPIQTIYDEIRDNYKSYAIVRNRYLVVVHTKLNSNVRIITVIPMNKKGLSKNGFRV